MAETVIRTWGYSASGAKVFELAPGEALPSGWVDNPGKVSAAVSNDQTVTIPDDWDKIGKGQALRRIRIAKQISPDMAELITDDATAIEVIEEEVNRRAKNG